MATALRQAEEDAEKATWPNYGSTSFSTTVVSESLSPLMKDFSTP